MIEPRVAWVVDEAFGRCEPCSPEREWRELGRGAFATVFLAGPNVVVKRYAAAGDDDDSDAFLTGAWSSYLLLREAASIRRLCHDALLAGYAPACPPLYSLRANSSTVELQMRRGACMSSDATIRSLARELSSGDPARNVLTELAHGSWRALDMTHTAGILHRDVKPPNMVLGASWDSFESAPVMRRPLDVMLVDWNSSRIFLTRRIFASHDRAHDAAHLDLDAVTPERISAAAAAAAAPAAADVELTPQVYTVYTRPPEVCSMTRRRKSAFAQSTYDSRADVWSMAMTLLITLSRVHEVARTLPAPTPTSAPSASSSASSSTPKRRRKTRTCVPDPDAQDALVHDAFQKAFVHGVKPSENVAKENGAMLRVLHRELCGGRSSAGKRLGSRWFKRVYGLSRIPAAYAAILQTIDLGLVFDPADRKSAREILHAVGPARAPAARAVDLQAAGESLTARQLQVLAPSRTFLAGVCARQPHLADACAFADAFAEIVCVRGLRMTKLAQPVCVGLLCFAMLMFSNTIPSVADMEDVCDQRLSALACMQSRDAMRHIMSAGQVFEAMPDVLARIMQGERRAAAGGQVDT